MAAEGVEICTKCGELKSLFEFGKYRRRGRIEFEYHCKVCRCIAGRAYYEDNKEKVLKRTAVWAKKNPSLRAKYSQNYRERNKDKVDKNTKIQNKKRLDGFNLDKFNKLFEEQSGVCAICGKPEVDKVGRCRTKADLAIDHNHNTNEIRGLLCGKCNKALGLLKVDDFGILNLQTAINYLMKGSKYDCFV